MNWNVPLDDERTLSIEQFCEVEGLTRQQYLTMRYNGYGPHELCIRDELQPDDPNVLIRITPSARRAWHRRLGQFGSGEEGTGRQFHLKPELGSPGAQMHEGRRRLQDAEAAGI